MQTLAFGLTHPGSKRLESEDVIRVDEKLGFYLVVDGSRGADGKWAAEELARVMHLEVMQMAPLRSEYLRSGDRSLRHRMGESFAHALQRAAEHIYKQTHLPGARQTTAASLVAGIWIGDALIWTHIGNARLYLFRSGKVHLLSRDHTYYEEMVRTFPPDSRIDPRFKKRLTRAVGDTERVPVEMHLNTLMEGDGILFCSNGLSDSLDLENRTLSEEGSRFAAETFAQQLLDQALSEGAQDNLSLIALEVKSSTENSSRSIPKFPVHPRDQLQLLKSMQILQLLKEDERSLMMIQNLLTYRQVGAGLPIVREGSESDEIFVILEGQAEVRSPDSVIASRAENDLIGEMGFFTRQKRSATVVAVTHCSLLSIHRSDFDALVRKDHRIGYAILDGVVRALSEKLREDL